jgi:hypothetical protein
MQVRRICVLGMKKRTAENITNTDSPYALRFMKSVRIMIISYPRSSVINIFFGDI